MPSFLGELNWFKDLALPILLAFFCSFVWSRSGSLLRHTRSKAARILFQRKLKWSTTVLMSDYTGGLSSFLSMQLAHLLVRCTCFLFGFVALMTFYVIMVVTKDDRGSLIILGMAIACGVLANMVRNVMEDISARVVASISPVIHVEKLGARNALSRDPEFVEEFERLRTLAQGIEDSRKGFIAASTVANKLLLADQPQQISPTEAA